MLFPVRALRIVPPPAVLATEGDEIRIHTQPGVKRISRRAGKVAFNAGRYG
jgi:hypothetical protein